MDASEKRKHAAFIISDWLATTRNSSDFDANQKEQLQQAIGIFQNVFDVDLQNAADQAEYSPKPANLTSILDIYLRTKKKTTSAPKTASKKTVSEEDKKKAEETKAQGNAKLGEKDFAAAIDLYTQAMQLDPSNPIYIANRAAAHSQSGDHEKAVTDCDLALAIDPKYTKAYSRKGFSLYNLAKYKDCVDAYTKALDLDPSNATIKTALEQARTKLKKEDTSVASRANETASAGGMPGFDPAALSSMLGNNPAMANIAEQMGGSGGLSALMNNPQVMEMAQQMMSNPAAMSNLMNMFGGAGAGK